MFFKSYREAKKYAKQGQVIRYDEQRKMFYISCI
jgi:hypothetical protein